VLHAREIDRIILQLDVGSINSENVREFIKRYSMGDSADREDPEEERKKDPRP
jgi:hypothetical protein